MEYKTIVRILESANAPREDHDKVMGYLEQAIADGKTDRTNNVQKLFFYEGDYDRFVRHWTSLEYAEQYKAFLEANFSHRSVSVTIEPVA